MSRLIDADELIRKMRNDVPIKLFGSMKNLGNVIGIVEEAPTVDAVEVVRCKDCKYWNPIGNRAEAICDVFNENTIFEAYCSYGERKE